MNDQKRMNRRVRLNRKKDRAVSPVVATLILILVAVAAAAALYLWLVAWQNSTTKQVGQPGAQASLAIGGSTTVFPVTEKAIQWFEANNSGVKVSDNPGGSGAGELSLCSGSGAIDIAAMSRPMKTAELALCPTAIQTVIGYDAVTATVTAAAKGATTNAAGISSFGEGELLAIFWQNGGQPTSTAGFPSVLGSPALASSSTPNLVGFGNASALNVPGYWGLTAPSGAGNLYEWSNIPKAACYDPNLVSLDGGTLTAAGYLATAPTSGPCHGAFATYATGTGIPTLYSRSDNSGTLEAFDNNVLGISCGTDNQLASCGFPYSSGTHNTATINVATGNPAVLALGQTDPNAIITGSWGLSTAPTSQGGGAAGSTSAVVAVVPLMGNSQSASVAPTLATIKTGIAAGYGNQVASGYIGWRPLQYVTLGEPTGESQRFIDFVLQPSNNQILLESNFYISIDQ